MRFNRGDFYSALLGGLVVAVVMAVLPAVASDGDPLMMGQRNSSKTVTRLNTRGGLYVNNIKAGKPALILNTVGATPPMVVNSTERVVNLNADLLDGWDHTDFVPVDQACTEEGSSVVGIDASGTLQCLVGGATTTTTPLPVVSVTVGSGEAFEEGSVPGVFTVTRTGDLSASLTVFYTVDGSALQTIDYGWVFTGSIVIPAGYVDAVLEVVPVDDTEFDPDETVIVDLAPGAYQYGSPATGTVIIRDNDEPG